MDKYLLNLYKQFCDARGIICNPFDYEKEVNDFIEWIIHNKKLTEQYRDFLLSLGYVDGRIVSEIGKGIYDTLCLTDALIISPYAKTYNLENADFLIIGDYPLIYKDGRIMRLDTEILLTHNPYEEMQIFNWSCVHNSNLCNISIGMYGNLHDSDFQEKIKILEEISKRMNDDYKVDYETNNDNYFCSINSKRKVKTKRRVLTI